MGHEKLIHRLFNFAPARVVFFQLADSILDGENWPVSPFVQIPPETRFVVPHWIQFSLGQVQHKSWHQNFVARFDHKLAHCVEVHCVVQEVLQVQFLVNKQLARFEVNKFLDQRFIFPKPAAAALAEPHTSIYLAE